MLQNTATGALGGAAVAAMLTSHRCSRLDVGGNLLRDQGASAIAEMLSSNHSLTTLDLRCVAVWCSVLQCGAVCCSVLQCLVVSCSVLQCVAVCCSAIADVLSSNHSLT